MGETRFQKTPAHFVQYLALKAVCVFVRLLPYRAAVFLGRQLVGFTRFVLHKRFKRVCEDIARAFPDKSPQQVHQIAVGSWCNMGQIFAEFLQFSAMDVAEFKNYCRIEGMEKLTKAQGVSGGIIHIGHFTNWEAFGLAASAYGFDKAVLAQRVDNPYVDEEINRLRNMFSGTTFYSNHQDKPFLACMRWLRKKKMLGILFDQNTISGEMWFSFLGRTAAFSPITALLAIKAQVPVFPVYVSRDNKGLLTCTVYDPIIPPSTYTLENTRQFTKTLIGYYEQWIRQNPASWLWAHNRWKREAEGNAYLEKHPEERL
ncbi:MAG: hypothetical protein IKP06_04585 [Elusimicrobiaceae bacterium]|nr:hypothetical protein [Elusimicrobiaceae bacterium]